MAIHLKKRFAWTMQRISEMKSNAALKSLARSATGHYSGRCHNFASDIAQFWLTALAGSDPNRFQNEAPYGHSQIWSTWRPAVKGWQFFRLFLNVTLYEPPAFKFLPMDLHSSCVIHFNHSESHWCQLSEHQIPIFYCAWSFVPAIWQACFVELSDGRAE